MKHAIILITSILLLNSCGTTKTKPKTANKKTSTSAGANMYHFSDTLSDEQLEFIKKNYNWIDEKILIINYRTPMDDCHFDNSKITREIKDWWNEFYKDIDTNHCLNIYVSYHGERVRKQIDNSTYFDDKANYLYLNFFNRKKSCFGFLAINNKGDYFQYNGHYSKNQMAILLFTLRNKAN